MHSEIWRTYCYSTHSLARITSKRQKKSFLFQIIKFRNLFLFCAGFAQLFFFSFLGQVWNASGLREIANPLVRSFFNEMYCCGCCSAYYLSVLRAMWCTTTDCSAPRFRNVQRLRLAKHSALLVCKSCSVWTSCLSKQLTPCPYGEAVKKWGFSWERANAHHANCWSRNRVKSSVNG